MRRMFACMLALLLGMAMPSLAAEPLYTVKDGDVLWTLSEQNLNNPFLWGQIVEKNAFLQEPGRVFERDGKTIVLLHPGEQLAGLTELGLLPRSESFTSLGLSQPAPVTVVNETMPVWGWSLLGLLALVALTLALLYAINRMLHQNPVTSRRAVVIGGVSPATAGAAFQRRAAEHFNRETGRNAQPQAFTILEQTKGRGWGTLLVSYGDGTTRPRELDGETVYKTRIQRPDGTVEEMMMLEACGNPIRSGRILSWLPGDRFRFEADQAAQPQPAPAVAEASAATAETHVASEPAPAQGPEIVNGQKSPFSIQFKRAANGRPNLVRIDGSQIGEFQFTQEGNGESVVIRFGNDPGAEAQAAE